ncbi:hypothetical protein BJ138DRAFT_1158916 [Hygrophoropsis aurantiaca]|uniref:Uncharacterized protein n=1 Tax=Hygrophoropsis aurantiaca TaxID=72124 RepID=A0ACB8A3F6_9AGAM|nr:hypothetical protein BJ138DRAFT_1158916 [Hygrophoropsis aurantiaca]
MASDQSSVQPTSNALAPSPEFTVEEALEHARRAFALKKYEQAVEHYATALELQTTKYGEDAPETADLYFLYGKALLENAISQASVLGKDQSESTGPELEDLNRGSGLNGRGPILSFSGDGDAEGEGDGTVDLFAQAMKEEEGGSDEDADGVDDDGEPEDDFNAAWEVLELARAIYEKGQDEDVAVKMKLADSYIALGDVSLETEKFDQAIADYTAGLAIKDELLPISSRQIAEAHYKLSMVLDLTSGRLSDAIVHAEKALSSIEHRMAELRDGLNGQLPPLASPGPEIEDKKGKGKGRDTSTNAVHATEAVQLMTRPQMEAELKELEGLKEDLALKVEELKTAPNEPSESAPAMAAKALDAELNGARSIPEAGQQGVGVVNDLTAMVVKKKKKPEDAADGAGKRKADDGDASPSAKKAKLEGETPT